MSEPDGVTAPSWSRKIGTLVEHEPNCGLRDGQRNNHYVSHKADGPENRFELFLLDDGQSKVEYKEETRKHPAVPLYAQLLTPLRNRCPQHGHLHL
jgi:DNA-directed RNA polymerase II subunit RPB11